MDREKIPVSKPSLGPKELEYTHNAIESTWISSSGYYLERMEEDLSSELSVEHIIPVANGTVALHLALLSLSIGEYDEVIVPSFTYIAAVNAVRYCGATPVFAEIDSDSWCISANSVSELISPKTKAIIVVHSYGMPAEMDKIVKLAEEHGIPVIEDAAEAIFSTYQGRPVGSFGTVSTFSLFGNKVLTSGEGGFIATNDRDVAHRIRLLRGQGMDPNRRFWFPIVGFNYRLTNVAAAIFCAQFERRQELLDKRWKLFEAYDLAFQNVSQFNVQQDLDGRTRSPWLYSIILNREFVYQRDKVIQLLDDAFIETRPFFYPVHQMPPYEQFQPRVLLDHSNDIAARGFNLPTFPDLNSDQFEYIVSKVKEVVDSVK